MIISLGNLSPEQDAAVPLARAELHQGEEEGMGGSSVIGM